ncbi:MAG: hypothetical protein U5L00_07060 [Desulfovermiculus sp.]|nr:hypothetical protein [Desulfovermiculus sp.]
MNEISVSLNDLAQAVCRFILSSFEFTDDVAHFAHCTLGLDSVEAIRSALIDPTPSCEPERECLIDLLLSPSMDQRLELESCLQNMDGSPFSDTQLVQALLQQCPQAHIAFPDGQTIGLDVDQDMMKGILGRLRLQQTLAPELKQALVQYVPPSWHPWLRVRMRLAATPLTANRAAFLGAVLKHVQVSSLFFSEYFHFALAFVQECSETEDMFRALAAKKEHLEHSLERADFLEKRRSGQAMEILLMQRLPMLSIDTATAQKEIRIIDDLCLALYGHIPAGFEQACQQTQVRHPS